MTASQVDCLSCISIDENFLLIILTILSISVLVTGRVLPCSRSNCVTWLVNSEHACNTTTEWSIWWHSSLHCIQSIICTMINQSSSEKPGDTPGRMERASIFSEYTLVSKTEEQRWQYKCSTWNGLFRCFQSNLLVMQQDLCKIIIENDLVWCFQ